MSREISMPIPLKDIGCQHLMITCEIGHNGFLRMRKKLNRLVGGMVNIKWPNKYVVLSRGCMYIFEHERSEKPEKGISLYGFSRVVVCTETDILEKEPWSFKITSQLSFKNSQFCFSAATKPEMEKWTSAFEDQIYFANGRDDSCRPAAPSKQRSASDRVPAAPQPAPLRSRSTSGAAQPSVPSDSDDSSDYSDVNDNEEIAIGAVAISSNTTDSRKKQMLAASLQERFQRPPTNTGNRPQVSQPSDEDDQPSAQGYYAVNKIFNQPPPKKPAVKPKQPAGAIGNQVRSESPGVYAAGEEYKEVKLPPTKPKNSYEKAYWDGDAVEGESIMKSMTADGVYMIRDPREGTQSDHQTLLVRIDGKLHKYRIYVDDTNRFSLDHRKGPFFPSKWSLIDHYKKNCLPEHAGKLVQPYSTYSTDR